MLVTVLNCRCYEAEDSLRTGGLKNRTLNAFKDPGKPGEILFEANGSSSRIRIEAKWWCSNQWSNLRD